MHPGHGYIILCDVITHPCHRHLLLANTSANWVMHSHTRCRTDISQGIDILLGIEFEFHHPSIHWIELLVIKIDVLHLSITCNCSKISYNPFSRNVIQHRFIQKFLPKLSRKIFFSVVLINFCFKLYKILKTIYMMLLYEGFKTKYMRLL